MVQSPERLTLHPGSADVNRRGFTFIEALIVFVLMGLIVMIAIPVMGRSLTSANVRNARTLAIGLYARARSSSLETGRVATLDFSGNIALITATPRLVPLGGSTVDTLGGPNNLQDLYGVTVTGNPSTTLTVDPRGLASSNATTIYFTKDGKTDSMAVSGFGRVVK